MASPQQEQHQARDKKAPAGIDFVPAQLVKPWKLPPQKKYLFKNANVVDPVNGAIVKSQTVALSNGLIESIGDNAPAASDGYEVVDLSGKYLCPGLIDCHVHLAAVAGNASLMGSLVGSSPANSHFRQPFLCRQMLSRGFTTVRDTGGATLALKEAIDDEVFPGPRIVLSNKALSQTGGHGDARGPHQQQQCCGGDTLLTKVIDGVPACIQAARDQIRTGADFIKIMVGGGVASPTDRLENTQFTADEIRAIADVAESYGTYVTAHAYTPKAIRHAVDNGVRCIEHGNFIDEDTAQYMAKNNVWLVPTLITYKAMSDDRFAGFLPPANRAKNSEVLASGLTSLRIAEAAGIDICHGSDLLGPLHEMQSREFAIRAQALSSAAVLRGATVTPARLLKQDAFLGQVKDGFAADLLVLNDNPLEDVSILAQPERSVLAVIKNGRVYTSRWQNLPEDVSQTTTLIE